MNLIQWDLNVKLLDVHVLPPDVAQGYLILAVCSSLGVGSPCKPLFV